MTDVVQVVQGGDHVVMRLVGDIDMANVDTVAQAINDAIANRCETADVHLDDVTYVDSAGLQMLFVLATRLRRLQIQLRVLARTGTPAQRVIELSGMSELLGVDATRSRPADG